MHLDFLFLLILRLPFAPSWWSLLWWPTLYPASFSQFFPAVQPASLFREQPRQLQRSVSVPAARRAPGRAGGWSRGGLWDSVCKVCGRVQGHPGPSHLLTTHSLTQPRATSSPASSVHGQCPGQVHHFYLLYHVFTVAFLCLETHFPLRHSCLLLSVP